jgi:hypothetical protein
MILIRDYPDPLSDGTGSICHLRPVLPTSRGPGNGQDGQVMAGSTDRSAGTGRQEKRMKSMIADRTDRTDRILSPYATRVEEAVKKKSRSGG